MRFAITALVLGVCPLLALAADKPRDLIVGKWEVVDDGLGGLAKGVIVEYKADGTVTASYGENKYQTGKYKFVEDNVMEFESKIGVKRYRVKVTKGRAGNDG
jgi:hypothetical protein